MEGAGNSGSRFPLLRTLVLITIALASIQHADAQCPTSAVQTDANSANDAASSGKTMWAPGEVVTYTCNPNFQVVTGSGVANTYTRICSGTTFAAASPGSCESVKCRITPPLMANAVANPNTNNQALAAVTTYTCNAGNIITGGGNTFTYTCTLKTGLTYEAEWVWTPGQTPTNPVCAAPVCPSAAPAESNAVAGTPSGTTTGSTITYTCNSGYQSVSGTTASQTFTRTCTGGNWAVASPAGCTAVRCLTIPPTESNTAAVPANTATTVGTQYTYTCAANFVVAIGDTDYIKICTQKSNNFEADWALASTEPAGASCIAFGCSTTPTVMANAAAGTVTLPSGGTAQVTYTCNTGYQAVTGTTPAASFVANCVGNTWTPSVTAGCTVIMCLTQPPTDTNAPVPTVSPLPAALGVTHTYTCNANYVVAVNNPDYVKICAAKVGSNYEAEWKLQTGEPAGAVCVAYTCASVALPTESNAVESPVSLTGGGVITFTCITGYQVWSGTAATNTYTRTCSAGVWGAATSSCVAMACRTVPPTFPSTTPSTTANNLALSTEVTYTCTGTLVIAPGDNNFNYICQAKTAPTFEAEWALKAGEPANPTCAVAMCPTTSPDTNAVAGTATGTTDGSTITYTCNDGYQVVSGTTATKTYTRTCTAGTWGAASPALCTAIKCLTAPPTDTNAPAPSLNLPATLGTTYMYTCNANFVVAVGDTTYVRICAKKTGSTFEGVWNLNTGEPTNAACVAYSCANTAIPAEANAVPGTPVLTNGGQITYTCSTGNQVWTSGTTVANTFTRTCSNSAWGAASPAGCTAIKCRTVPPTLPSAAPTPNTINLALATVTTYTCTGTFVIAPGVNTFPYTCQLKSGSTFDAEWAYTGTITNPVCAAPVCPGTGPVDTNANAGTPTGTSDGSTITYTCNDGFQAVSGTTATATYTRTCASGTWGAPSPALCTAIQCLTAPPTDTNAPAPSLNLPATLGTTYMYTCNTNFVVAVGDTTYVRICTKKSGSTFEGVWNLNAGEPSTAACVAYSCANTAVPTESNAAAGTPVLTGGGQVTYTCSAGYQVWTTGTTVANTFTRTCSNSAWGAASPAGCTAIACRTVPPTLTNASPNPNTNNQFLNADVTYTCTAGNVIAPGVSTFLYTCQLKSGSTFDAEWAVKPGQTVASPVCAVAMCPTTGPGDTNASPAAATGTTDGSTITYTCSDGYQVVSGTTATQTYTRTCMAGIWGTATPALCTAIKCLTAPPTDTNAPAPSLNLPATLGTTYTYTCNANFVVAVGDTNYVRICAKKSGSMFEGVWNLNTGEQPNAVCTAYSCASTAVPAEANAVAGTPVVTGGGQVTYTCNTGYQVWTSGTTVTKTFTRTCSNSAWGAASPAGCAAIACRTVPPTLTNASPNPNTNNQLLNAEVTYTCTAGNIIAPGVSIFLYTCQLKSGSTFDAEWALKPGQAVTNPVCAVAMCPTTGPGDTNASPAAATGTTDGSTITYTCSDGYQVVSGTTATKTYTRTCMAGIWGTATPALCTVIKCLTAPPTDTNAPAPSLNPPVTLGITYTYTCNANFVVAVGDTSYVRICAKKSGSTFEGVWNLNTGEPLNAVCTAYSCASTAVPAEANAVAGTPVVTGGGQVTYTCNTGYQVWTSGTTVTKTFTRTCSNSAWGAASPAGCSTIACRTVPPTLPSTSASNTANNQVLGTEVTYTCTGTLVIAPGDNNFNYICQLKTGSTFDAEWVLKAGEPTNPTCTATSCPATGPADSFAVAGTATGTTAGSTITYTCNDGFQVVSGTTATKTYTRTCTNGIWGAASPALCSALQCLTAPPTDANAPAPTVNAPAALGITQTYTCNANNVVGPNDPSYVRICKKKTGTTYVAEWALATGEPAGAQCIAIMCTTATIPATDTNATPGTPTATTVGATVTYTCKSGYQVVSGTTATSTYTRACTAAGWGAATPATCTVIKCLTAPPTATGATITPAVSTPATIGTLATYACSTNYVVAIGDTSYVRKCQQKSGSTFEGEWALNTGEPANAACVAYNCRTAAAPTARTNAVTGAISLANGGEVTYTCTPNNQYRVNVNGALTAAASFKITCTNNAWPTTPTGCVATACVSQPPTESNAPAPAAVTLPAAVSTLATYTCNSGYVVAVGDTNYDKICQIKSSATYQGEWVLKASEPTGATCSAFTCPTTAPVRNNAVAGTIVTSGGGSITYTCNSGHEYKVGSTISSTFTIKCTSSAWPSSPTGCTGRSLRGWEIALITIGVLLAVGGIILVGCLCWWYNKNKAADPSDLRQLQVDPRSQDYAYPPGVPPYTRGGNGMAPYQPYSTRPIDAPAYNRGRFDTGGKFDNYMYGSKPSMPY